METHETLVLDYACTPPDENGTCRLHYNGETFEVTKMEEKDIPVDLKPFGALRIDRETRHIEYGNVPAEYLPYACYNEVAIPDVLSAGNENSQIAMEEELSLVPKEKLSDYITWRIAFFQGIAYYYASQVMGYEEKLKTEPDNAQLREWREGSFHYIETMEHWIAFLAKWKVDHHL